MCRYMPTFCRKINKKKRLCIQNAFLIICYDYPDPQFIRFLCIPIKSIIRDSNYCFDSSDSNVVELSEQSKLPHRLNISNFVKLFRNT